MGQSGLVLSRGIFTRGSRAVPTGIGCRQRVDGACQPSLVLLDMYLVIRCLAAQSFQQSLSIYQKLFGPKHQGVARLYAQLSLAFESDVQCAQLYADSALFALNFDTRLLASQFPGHMTLLSTF